ncbi:MAG: hypothetical protein WA081_22460, partial [Desulfosalsimonadaceae bacterium]
DSLHIYESTVDASGAFVIGGDPGEFTIQRGQKLYLKVYDSPDGNPAGHVTAMEPYNGFDPNPDGNYSDIFSDNAGLVTKSNVDVDMSSGFLKLTNADNTFLPPYHASGFAITRTIMPLSVVEWGVFSYTAVIPPGTSIKIQVLDECDDPFSDAQLPGNTVGFTANSIDLSQLNLLDVARGTHPEGSDSKIARLRFKIILETTDVNVTPSIDSLVFTWKIKDDVLPTPSSLNNSGWPTSTVDYKGTYHTAYSNPQKYYAIKWKSVDLTRNDMFLNGFRIYQDSLIGMTWFDDPHFYQINRNNGNIQSEIPSSNHLMANDSIDQNGILYSNEIMHDIFSAIDLNTGKIKWTYAYGGGHGNSQTLIGKDGSIFTIYTPYPSHGKDTLYAFNPDGTIKFTKDIQNPDNPYDGGAGYMSQGDDGTLYFASSTYDQNYQRQNLGKLYAVNPNNGSVIWSNPIGDANYNAPILDADGNIYVFEFVWEDSVNTKKYYSFHPGGTLRWQKEVDETFMGWQLAAYRDDGKIVALRRPNNYNDSCLLDLINMADGSIESSTPINFASALFTDKDNNTYLISWINDISIIRIYDPDMELIWQCSAPSGSVNGNIQTSYGFDNLIQDEKGWLYSGFAKSVYDTTNWERQPDQQYVNFIGIAPWTLAATVESADELLPGNTANFTVTTAMEALNPLTNGQNQVQIVIENGDKIPLTYSGINNNNETVWLGSYVIPSTFYPCVHTFTAEANSDSVKTGIPVHFDSSASGSENTGIMVTGSFGAVNLIPGDINHDGIVDLSDAVLALQIMAGIIVPTQPVFLDADVNHDGRIGMEEVIFIFQKVAGQR